MDPMLNAALELAKRGKPVFPLAGKHPAIKDGGGFKDATTNETILAAFWTAHPGAGIGMPTGAASGFLILDVDPRHDGDKMLADAEARLGKLPETLRVATGGGGWHYYFKLPPGGPHKWRKQLGPGVDVKADGGYVVLPPSLHPDTGKRYGWATKAPPVDAPQWLLDLILKPLEQADEPAPPKRDVGSYLQAALDKACGAVVSAREGGRNHVLNHESYYIGQLVAGAGLDRTTAEGALLRAARAAGLSEFEAKRTIKSGFESGGQKPRAPKQDLPPKPTEGRMQPPQQPARPRAVSLRSTRMADVTRTRVEWLWAGRIPFGKLTVLDGDPSLGKSTITLDLAARGSRAQPMPDGSPSVAFRTTILAAEDGLADTMVGRLEAHGADLSLIDAVQSAELADGSEDQPTIRMVDVLSEHLIRLQREAGVHRSLLIIDPLTAYLGDGVDAFRDDNIRRALMPLAQMADRLGAAVLCVRHLNKAVGGNAIYRGGGSIAIAAAARSVLLVGKDPDNQDEHRILAVTKGNLAAAQTPALRYRIAPTADGATMIEWLGEARVSADQLVAPAQPDEPGSLESAIAWLAECLADGPMSSVDIRKQSEENGIAFRTLVRAKERMKIVAEKSTVPGGPWRWRLP